MNIQLIIIGDEILIGKTRDLNTNSTANLLRQTPFQLSRVHIISDNAQQITETLAHVHNAGDIAIISGGLGPTLDDITKKTIADYLEVEIQESSEVEKMVLEQYKRGNRAYTRDTHHYHLFPIGAEPLYNPTGFAPGIYFGSKKPLFCLPGVPHEFFSMFDQSVIPKLNLLGSNKYYSYRVCKTFGLAESKIFNEIAPGLWDALSKNAKVSSLPHIGGVDIGLTIDGKSSQELKDKEEKVFETLRNSPLKKNILHQGEDLKLEQIIIKEAAEKKLKIGSAESCTGGLVASRLTDISGSSSCFWGSIISYSNEVKVNQLNVESSILESHGAVSEETAYEMAKGARENLNLDIAVATTGIAGPGGGSKEKPVGTVGIAISSNLGTRSQIYHFNGNRDILKLRFSEMALIQLLIEIRRLT